MKLGVLKGKFVLSNEEEKEQKEQPAVTNLVSRAVHTEMVEFSF